MHLSSNITNVNANTLKRFVLLKETSQIFHSPPSNANPTPPHKSKKWLLPFASL
jgi:hypothetical protein